MVSKGKGKRKIERGDGSYMGEGRAKARTGCHYDMRNRSTLVPVPVFLVRPQSSITTKGLLSVHSAL